jgi:DinB superfamily
MEGVEPEGKIGSQSELEVISQMPTWSIGRPEPTEMAPHVRAYVELVEGNDIERVLIDQIQSTRTTVERIEDKCAAGYVYAPGKWTIKEVIGHVVDTERILAYRALCIARGETGALPSFDQDAYARAAGANKRSLESILQEFTMVRYATLALFANLPQDALLRTGTVGPWNVSVRGLAFHIAGHQMHHFRILSERYLPAEARH